MANHASRVGPDFYDHVLPPHIDENGYGIRVPSLVVSPYARRGYIDHQTLSFDAIIKFIEDDFLTDSDWTHAPMDDPTPVLTSVRSYPARRHHRGLRFQSNTTPTADSAAPPAAGTGIKAGWITTVERRSPADPRTLVRCAPGSESQGWRSWSLLPVVGRVLARPARAARRCSPRIAPCVTRSTGGRRCASRVVTCSCCT